MSVNVGHLYKKRTVRRLDGSIRDLSDESNGGAIIRDGIVVNQAALDEIARKEEDKRMAAQAESAGVQAPPEAIAVRTAQPGKIEELEKKVNDMDTKLDAILKAINK